MGDAPVGERDGVAEAEPWVKPKLTFRRLFGLDRSGPPPPATLPGAPWNVWTIPNAIGFVRLALIPVFLVLALQDDDVPVLAAVIYAVIGWSDYADGIAARVTGQYSRFGALLDPVVDRLLIISGIVVCWAQDLLPHVGLALLVLREVLMLVAGRWALSRGVVLQVNWPGRLAVWPVMSAIFFPMVGLEVLGEVCLWIGLVLAYWATALYARDAMAQLRGPAPSSST